MGKLTVHIATGFFLVMGCITMWGQQITRGKNKAAKSTDAVHEEVLKHPGQKDILVPQTYLGHSDLSGGKLTYMAFDSLLQQGIYGRDQAGKQYRVISFLFNYAERKVYEDSVGNMSMMTDYSSEPCFGNKVDSAVFNAMSERLKGGDTVYIDRVMVTQEGTPIDTFLGKGMKFVIAK